MLLPLHMIYPHPLGGDIALDLTAALRSGLRRFRACGPKRRRCLNAAFVQPAAAHNRALLSKIIDHRILAIGKRHPPLHKPATKIDPRHLTARHAAPVAVAILLNTASIAALKRLAKRVPHPVATAPNLAVFILTALPQLGRINPEKTHLFPRNPQRVAIHNVYTPCHTCGPIGCHTAKQQRKGSLPHINQS